MKLIKRLANGFTIIELLIVIVIIGVLATLAIVTQSGYQSKNRDNERKTDLNTISGYLEAYNAKNLKYPTLTELNDNDPANPNSFVSQNMKNVDRAIFRDPSNKTREPYKLVLVPANNVYAYTPAPANCDNGTTGDCTAYTLTAALESGNVYTVHEKN